MIENKADKGDGMAIGADSKVEREIDEAMAKAENPRTFTVELESCFEEDEELEFKEYCSELRSFGAEGLSTKKGPNGWPCVMVTGTLAAVLRCIARHNGHWHDMTVDNMIDMIYEHADELGLE
jgi:hypothetical protein